VPRNQQYRSKRKEKMCVSKITERKARRRDGKSNWGTFKRKDIQQNPSKAVQNIRKTKETKAGKEDKSSREGEKVLQQNKTY